MKNFKQVFEDKGFSTKSAGIYSSWLGKLSKYYPNVNLNDLNIDEIKRYVDILKTRKNLSGSSRIQAKRAYAVWFNDVLNKNYDFDTVVVERKYQRESPDFYTEKEILELIASSQSLKARMINSIAYSCGLDVGLIRNIKKSDVDIDNKNIRINYKDKVRFAVIADSLVEDLKNYLNENKPRKWLFEGNKSRKQISMQGIHWAFKKALENSSLDKYLDFQSLKYSYIKHLELLGQIPLKSILDELNLTSSSTYYALSIAGVDDKSINLSPLDLLRLPRNESEFNTNYLLKQIDKVNNDDEREYISEAINCLNAGSYRAGIIFMWNYTIRVIHNRLLQHSLHSLNQAIQKHFGNARQIQTIDDFSYIKESTVLKAALDLGEFDKNQKKVLEECLNVRNLCSHPGKYAPTPVKALSTIEDMINIIH